MLPPSWSAVEWAWEERKTCLDGCRSTGEADHASFLRVFKTTKPSSWLIRRAPGIHWGIQKGKSNMCTTCPSQLTNRSTIHTGVCCQDVWFLGTTEDLPISTEALWKVQQKDSMPGLYTDANIYNTFSIMEDLISQVAALPILDQLHVPARHLCNISTKTPFSVILERPQPV